MDLSFEVKECAGVGATSWPVLVVVPLEEGQYQDTSSFRVTQADGTTNVLAQIEVLNRWWGKDNSIRHLRVQFMATVSAYSGGISTGKTTYRIKDDGANGLTGNLSVTDGVNSVDVDTGVISFSIPKPGFEIEDVYLGATKVIESGKCFITDRFDTVMDSSARTDTTTVVEETGPIRTVIRIEGPTEYVDTSSEFTPGFGVRIYAWNDLPYIGVEYQIRNSDHTVQYSWPFYFKSLDIQYTLPTDATSRNVRIALDDSVTTTTESDTPNVRQTFDDTAALFEGGVSVDTGTHANGFMDISDSAEGIGVTAYMRYMWEMWPNGFAADNSDHLTVELFPDWSKQWVQLKNDALGDPPNFTSTDYYWIDDMCHVCKKMMLHIHDGTATDSQLVNIGKTFQNGPVPVIDTSWYRSTAVTIDLDGLFPYDAGITERNDRIFDSYISFELDHTLAHEYNFGWNNFYMDVFRKHDSRNAGGWPYGFDKFFASGDPADYREAEQFAYGDLNVRPIWLSREYIHATHYASLELTDAPYGGKSWRAYPYAYAPYLDANPLANTLSGISEKRDNQHGWFYHMYETYYMTGDYWILDWYQFLMEFRRAHLLALETFMDGTSRGRAHPFAATSHGYQLLGKSHYLSDADSFIDWLKARQIRHGVTLDLINGDKEHLHFAGYLSRAIMTYMREIPVKSDEYAKAFNLVYGIVMYNVHIGNFAGLTNAIEPNVAQSSYQGTGLADPQAWMYWKTGHTPIKDHLFAYKDNPGINGGTGLASYGYPYVGGYHGRYFQALYDGVLNRTPNPPPIISDLNVTSISGGVQLTWTGTVNGGRYIVVYDTKPIAGSYTTDDQYQNWWRCAVKSVPDTPSIGGQVTFDVMGVNDTYNFAVLTFSPQDDLSEISGAVSNDTAVTLTSHSMTLARGNLSIFIQTDIIAYLIAGTIDVPGEAVSVENLITKWTIDEGTGTAVSDDEGSNDIDVIGTKYQWIGSTEIGLLDYWTFNQTSGNDAVSIGSSANSIGCFGTFTWRPTGGQVSGAVELYGGSSDYFSNSNAQVRNVPCQPAYMKPPTTFSISAWVYLKGTLSPTNRHVIMCKQSNTERGFIFSATQTVSGNAPHLTVWKDGSSASTVTSNTVITLNTWHHIVASYQYVTDGTSRMRIYLNNSLVGSSDTAVGPPAGNWEPFCIGAFPESNEFFIGLLDEVRLYNYELTSSDVNVLYTGTGPKNLVLNQNGTPADAYMVATDGSLEDVPALANGTGTASFTVGGWVRVYEDLLESKKIPFINKMGQKSTGNYGGWSISATGANVNKPEFEIRSNDSSNRTTITSNALIDAYAWQHIAASYYSTGFGTSEMRLYLNGLMVANSLTAVGPVQNNAQPLEIGRYRDTVNGNNDFLVGGVKDVRIYDFKMSDEQVLDWYESGEPELAEPVSTPGTNLGTDAHDDIIGESLVGSKIYVYWSAIETSKDTYDFSRIDTHLTYLNGQSKNLQITVLTEGEFVLPAYMTPGNSGYEANFGNSFVRHPNNYNYKTPLYWNSYVMDRIIALFNALATEYDGSASFAAIATWKTDISISDSDKTANSYSASAYITQLERLSATKTNWPSTPFYFGVDTIPDASAGQMSTFITNVAGDGCGFCCPKVIPTENLGQGSDLFAYAKLSGAPLSADITSDVMGGDLGDFTPEELLDYAANQLNASIVCFTNDPAENTPRYRFNDAVIPAIDAFEAED